MKRFTASVAGWIPWLNLPMGVLIALLQRTPALRVVAAGGDYVIASPVGQVLRAAFTLATVGAMHSLAGATKFEMYLPGDVLGANPILGVVGVPFKLGFTYTGTPSAPQHFNVKFTLPPGLSYDPPPDRGAVISGSPAIVGTPTQAGTYIIEVQGVGLAGQGSLEPIQFIISGGATTTVPAITTQPQTQTVNAGATVTFTVAATGSPAPTYQWRKDNVNLTGATNTTLTLPNVATSAAGVYSVLVANSAGTVSSASATLAVTPLPGSSTPVIVSQPIGYAVGPGGTATLSVVATGSSLLYEWRKDGVLLPAATGPALTFANVSVVNAGTYVATISNGAGAVTSTPAVLSVAAGESRLANLSVRANLGRDQTLFVGFAINGTKTLLLRGIGPTLGVFGVPGAYNDPRLELFEGAVKFAENDNWNSSLEPVFASVGAFPLTAGSKDAALQTAISGSRTAQLKGPDSGVVLVEVYDAGSGGAVRLVNVSARNIVGTGDDILIAGFVVSGTVAKTLLVRAVGPTLGRLGVSGTLVDPKLEIYTGAPALKIIENDNWAPALAPVFSSVGAFELDANSRDAALLVTLPPGAYTAQVYGVGDGTGEAIVEVYEVP